MITKWLWQNTTRLIPITQTRIATIVLIIIAKCWPSGWVMWGSVTNNTHTKGSSLTWATFFLFRYAAIRSRKDVNQNREKRGQQTELEPMQMDSRRLPRARLSTSRWLRHGRKHNCSRCEQRTQVGIYIWWEIGSWGTSVFEWTWIIWRPREEINGNHQITRHGKLAQTLKHGQASVLTHIGPKKKQHTHHERTPRRAQMTVTCSYESASGPAHCPKYQNFPLQ